MAYDTYRRSAHRVERLRPVPPGAHPPLPISPAPLSRIDRVPAGPPPGQVVHFETRYHGVVPSIRRLDDSGRILLGEVADVLGWSRGEALSVTAGPGHWVTLRSAGRPARASDRRHAHLDERGRLVVPKGVRAFLDAAPGTEVVARLDPERATLALAHASLLARALDALERLEAAERLTCLAAEEDGPAETDCTVAGWRDGHLAHGPHGGRR